MTSDQGTYFANHLCIQVKLNYIIHDDVKLVVIVSVTAEISGKVVAIGSQSSRMLSSSHSIAHRFDR